MKQNIPLNKGNYNDMEPQEREELFNKYRSEGWEEEYKTYRENWAQLPQNQIVSDYPVQLDVELSNICNLNCPMCFRGREDYLKKTNAKFMDFNLYKKIIDEVSGHVTALRLSLRGESTLHPKIVDCIKYAKDKGVKEISFLTNGSKLNKEYFIELMLAGVDWITISIDGMSESYEKIRKPLKFEETLHKIKDIKEAKEEYNSNRPVIKIQSVWPAIRKRPEEFYNTFAPYVDLIAFNPLVDFFTDDNKSIEYVENFSCPQIYQRMIIGADGIAMMCTNDDENSQYIGDANKESIYDIWHGEKLNHIRALHKEENGFRKISACLHCYYPLKTTEIETASVNGRKFIIKDYVAKNKS